MNQLDFFSVEFIVEIGTIILVGKLYWYVYLVQ